MRLRLINHQKIQQRFNSFKLVNILMGDGMMKLINICYF